MADCIAAPQVGLPAEGGKKGSPPGGAKAVDAPLVGCVASALRGLPTIVERATLTNVATWAVRAVADAYFIPVEACADLTSSVADLGVA